MGLILSRRLMNSGAVDPYFINANAGSFNANSSSVSWSHTTTSDTTCLIVGGFVNRDSGDSSINSVTYNSVSLTTIQNNANRFASGLFVMFSPPVGTYTVSVSCTGGNRGISFSSMNIGGASVVDISGGESNHFDTADPKTINVTSSARGLAVGNAALRASNNTTMVASATSPTGMVVAHTANRFSSSSFARWQAIFYSPTLVNAGSTNFTVDVTTGSLAGRGQQYAILR
jgi:hypothetical protein